MGWLDKRVIVVDITTNPDEEALAVLEDDGDCIIRVHGDPNKAVAVINR